MAPAAAVLRFSAGSQPPVAHSLHSLPAAGTRCWEEREVSLRAGHRTLQGAVRQLLIGPPVDASDDLGATALEAAWRGNGAGV